MKQLIDIVVKVGGAYFLVTLLYDFGRIIDEMVEEYLEQEKMNKTKNK